MLRKAFLASVLVALSTVSAFGTCSGDNCTPCACYLPPPPGSFSAASDVCPNLCGGFNGGCVTLMNEQESATYYPFVKCILHEWFGFWVPISSETCASPIALAIASRGYFCQFDCDFGGLYYLGGIHSFIRRSDLQEFVLASTLSDSIFCN